MSSLKRHPAAMDASAPITPVRHQQSLKKHPSVDSGASLSGSVRRHAAADDAASVRGSVKKHPSVDSGSVHGSVRKHPSVDDAARHSFKKSEAEDKAAIARQDRMKKMAEERYRFEQRVLTLCTGMLVVIGVLWTVALSTDHWYELDPASASSAAGTPGVYLRDSGTVVTAGHSGLWRLCTEQFHPNNISAYESATTTAMPISTTKRPRAAPCRKLGLRGRKRIRCRHHLARRFKYQLSLAARRKSALRLNIPQSGGAGGAANALTPVTTTPSTPADYDDPAANLTDFLKADFDDQTQQTDKADPASPDVAEEDALLEQEKLSPEAEKLFLLFEEGIDERKEDAVFDDLTVNETITEVVEEAVEELTSVSFVKCRVRELSEDDETAPDWQMLSYMRTLVTFSVVSVLLLVLGFLSALYTFKEPRYTFKRLSAGIQFISFSGLLVVIQVYRNASAYEQWVLLGGVPLTVGYSQVLAWVTLAAQLLSSFFFLLYSRKRKRNKAPTEEIAMADEPAIIGR